MLNLQWELFTCQETIKVISTVDLRVLFKLCCLFLYFKTRSLTPDEIINCSTHNIVYLLPYSKSRNLTYPVWAEQEDALLDSRGEVAFPTVKQPKQRSSEQDKICPIEAIEAEIDRVLISPWPVRQIPRMI